MLLYLVPPASAYSPAFAQATAAVPCRRCPGGISRSTRGLVYPSDMSDGEWAVIEPLLRAPGWTLGRGGSPGSYWVPARQPDLGRRRIRRQAGHLGGQHAAPHLADRRAPR